MTTHELIALAEKYERWAAIEEMPEEMAREYRAIAEGLRMLAGQDTRPLLAKGE